VSDATTCSVALGVAFSVVLDVAFSVEFFSPQEVIKVNVVKNIKNTNTNFFIFFNHLFVYYN